MLAITAAQPQEAEGLDAALQEGVELVLDELRQIGPGDGFGLGEGGRSVLQHQAVQRGLLRAVVLDGHGPAVGRPLGPPDDGSPARLPRS